MIPSRRSVRLVPIAIVAVGSVLAGCGDDESGAAGSGDDGASSTDAGSSGETATVVATTSIWGDVVDAATCNGEAGLEVTSILPPDADPHHYEASLQDRETLDEADVVVSNGLDLEEGLTTLLETVPSERHVMIADLPGLTIRSIDEHAEHADEEAHDEHAEHEDEHDHGGGDPHLWLDPRLVADAVTPLTEQIVAATGVDAGPIAACAADYVDRLRQLDGDIAQQVEAIPSDERVLVTNHDAYGYFADRYGFEIVGTVIPSTSTMAETNPADLEELTETIEHEGVPAIFVDAQNSDTEAQALADRIGDVEVVVLNTEGVGEDTDNDTYLTMMASNTGLIVDALGKSEG